MAHIKRKYIDKHWLVFCFRGIMASLFGFFALSGKIIDLSTTISITSVFLLTMGIIDSSNALYSSVKKHGWLNSVFDALVDVVAALALLFVANQNITASLIIIASYTVISGLIDIIHSLVTVEDMTDRFIRIILGICGAIMGFAIINAGDFEITTFIRFFGAYMLIVGVLSFIYGIHNHDQDIEDKEARKESAKKAAKTRAAVKVKATTTTPKATKTVAKTTKTTKKPATKTTVKKNTSALKKSK